MPDAVQFSSKQPSAGGPTSEVSNVKLDAVVTSRNICDVSEGLDTSSSAAEAEESSDSDSEIHSINTNIKDQIQQWALKYQIPQNALNELLTISIERQFKHGFQNNLTKRQSKSIKNAKI